MRRLIRIGTRESQLAIWQATEVKEQLAKQGFSAELVPIKSEGDIDLCTPLYQMGVQGVFTRSLDAAILNNKIDIAVHSMKDVPIQLARGIVQSAVLKRASHKDILVHTRNTAFLDDFRSVAHIATSSVRRRAQWLNRYPDHIIENIRGNVNTRLQKLKDSHWQGAIFAAAGLERIQLRPENSIDLNWMLPAPAQGAILVVCREDDFYCREASATIHHQSTALCTSIERDFLKKLMGGCSTPISALAEIKNNTVHFEGNILSLDGKEKVSVNLSTTIQLSESFGIKAAEELLNSGGDKIAETIRNAAK